MKKKKKRGKKKLCRTWMGYCPIELKAGLGTGRAGRARGTQARRWLARGRARGWASRRAAGRKVRAGHGRAACAHRLGHLGARAPGLVFSLVFRLDIFPESLNEHCSL